MHPFLRKILDATRLTRTGKLSEATRTIQHALAASLTQAGAHATHDRGAVDAAVVEAPAAFAPEPPAAAVPAVEPPEVPIVGDDPPPPVRPATGLGRFFDSSFTGAAGTRAFKLFVPDGCDGEAVPLVVMLHGCTQDPDDFAAGTRMNSLAQEEGFLVLYPAQAPRSNSHRCWNWFSPQHQRRGSGEPALLAGMTRHVLQTHSVDPARVYVAGLSAGGAMAAILAREYPDVFAAAGIHSGVAPGSANDVASAFMVMKSGPRASADCAAPFAVRKTVDGPNTSDATVPLIVFHGDIDQTVAAANGDAVVAAALGAQPVVATTSEGTSAHGERSFRRTVWRREDDAAAPSIAEHWTVHGSAHAWSGGAGAGSYTDPSGPDASREMLRFFVEHPRRV
jgi:poly(hydroxyalkanoate) depolymerase family esterase